MTLKATGDETHGSFGLTEQLAPPGFAPPRHVHHDEDEEFYILEGSVTFYCGSDTFKAGSGSYVFMPRDVEHAFKVEGPEPARLLQINSPAGLERFFEEASEPAQQLILPPPAPPDIEKLTSVAAKYNIEIVGPPPS
jgi:mannose-6-phosphate isomerase-like protein (cupin superfamily)